MDKVLNSSKHIGVKTLYNKYRDQLTVKDANYKGGAFFRPGEGVSFNASKVEAGDMIHKPYQTAFHEFGHNIDYLMGNGSPISESWGDNALYKAIKNDFDVLKGKQSNEQLIGNIKKEMETKGYSVMDTASVSDMLESLTGTSYPLGAGHGKDYWIDRKPNREFFAEVLDGAASNERSYVLMKQMFPRAVKIVDKIIGGGLL